MWEDDRNPVMMGKGPKIRRSDIALEAGRGGFAKTGRELEDGGDVDVQLDRRPSMEAK